MTKEYKKRIYALDFIRAICALGIVVYHFSCSLTGDLCRPLYMFSCGNWGYSIVTAFFIVSGASIYFSNPCLQNKADIIVFYKKRIKSIFPLFYIVFIPLYIFKAIVHHNLFYKGNPCGLLLSFLGVDGYFNYKFITYYQVGEWFLGAIILIYLLYPIILFLVKRNAFLTLLGCIVLYIFVVYDNNNYFEIEQFRNLFSCLVSFVLGIIFIENESIHKSKIALPLSLVVGGYCFVLI